MKRNSNLCIFCETAEGSSFICETHIEAFKLRFASSNNIVMKTECYFCSPVLAIPGSKPFPVIEKQEGSQIAICIRCVNKQSSQRNAKPKVFAFPKK